MSKKAILSNLYPQQAVHAAEVMNLMPGLSLRDLDVFVVRLSEGLYARFNLKVIKRHVSKARDLTAEAIGFTAGGYQQALALLPKESSQGAVVTTQAALDKLVLGINEGLGKYFDMKMSVRKLPALRAAVVDALSGMLQLEDAQAGEQAGQSLWVLRDGSHILAVFRAGMWAFESAISKSLLESLDLFAAAMDGTPRLNALGRHGLLCTGDIDTLFSEWMKSGAAHFKNIYCRGVDVGIARDLETALYLSGLIEEILSGLSGKERSSLMLREQNPAGTRYVRLLHNKAKLGVCVPCTAVNKDAHGEYQLCHPQYGTVGVMRDAKGYALGGSVRRFDHVQL